MPETARSIRGVDAFVGAGLQCRFGISTRRSSSKDGTLETYPNAPQDRGIIPVDAGEQPGSS
jgi:hypothetical protein